MMRISGTILALFLVTWAGSANAETDEDRQSDRGHWAVGITGGTLGIGVEGSMLLHPNFVLRANGTWGDLSFLDNVVHGNADYATKSLTVMSAGLMLDWHLFRDAGRISLGARYLSYDLAADAQADKDVTINKTVYTPKQLAGMKVAASNDSPVLPYLGLGYDSALFKSYGLSLSTDFGALVGMKHNVELSGGQITEADRVSEQDKIKSSFDKLSIYPVLMLAAKYRF